jgi:hypothetical protein
MLRNELYTPWFNNSDWGFEVIDGEFSGVVVQVTELKLKEETDEDDSNLSVNYHIISKPEIITEEQVKSDLFNALFQTIITDIVKEAVEAYDSDNNRNNNSKESDPQ